MSRCCPAREGRAQVEVDCGGVNAIAHGAHGRGWRMLPNEFRLADRLLVVRRFVRGCCSDDHE